MLLSLSVLFLRSLGEPFLVSVARKGKQLVSRSTPRKSIIRYSLVNSILKMIRDISFSTSSRFNLANLVTFIDKVSIVNIISIYLNRIILGSIVLFS